MGKGSDYDGMVYSVYVTGQNYIIQTVNFNFFNLHVHLHCILYFLGLLALIIHEIGLGEKGNWDSV